MNSAASGSTKLSEEEIASSPIEASTATDCIAHRLFCAPSPAVAAEPSWAPRRFLAWPSSGMTTIAPAVSAIPKALVSVW